jgi:hypothetical protein
LKLKARHAALRGEITRAQQSAQERLKRAQETGNLDLELRAAAMLNRLLSLKINQTPKARADLVLTQSKPDFRHSDSRCQLATLWPADTPGVEALKAVGNSEPLPENPGPARNEKGELIFYWRFQIEWKKDSTNPIDWPTVPVAEPAEVVPNAEPGNLLN